MKAILIAACLLILAGSAFLFLACCKISGDCARQEEACEIKEEPTP